MNYAVIGSGISGLSVSALLRQRGHSISLFEGRNIGGLVSCSSEQGSLFHRVGGHVFNSRNQHVLDWFWSFFDKEDEFLSASRRAVIAIGSSFVDYPIELNLHQLSRSLSSHVVEELVELASVRDVDQDFRPGNFRDFLLNTFGATLCDIYFFKYNAKIWQRDLETMSLDWLDGKLPMATPLEIIKSNILGSKDSMVHSTFFYPKHGGSQFIANRLASGVNINRHNVDSIQLICDDALSINGADAAYAAVFYTGDIRNLKSLLSDSLLAKLNLDEDCWKKISLLSSNPTTTMLCECDANEYSWVYLPGDDTAIHRIIMTGNFSPENNGPLIPPSRITCTIEHSGYLSENEMEKEASRLPFNVKPLAYNFCDSSYIVHGHGTRDLVSRVVHELAKVNIHCVGRFAEWQYYNMDAAIEASMKLVDSVAPPKG